MNQTSQGSENENENLREANVVPWTEEHLPGCTCVVGHRRLNLMSAGE